MKLLLFFMLLFVTLCIVYGSPIIKANQKDKPYDNCVCKTFSCACCGTLEIPQIGINDTACVSFAYLPKEYGISLVLEIDSAVLINETISAKNPPPICLPIPYIEDFVDVCVHFTDLAINNSVFHGCVALEARMWWVYVVAEYSLGCFDASNFNRDISKLTDVNFWKGNTSKLIKATGISGNVTSASDVLLLAKNVFKSIQLFKNKSVPSIEQIHTNEI